MQTCVHKTMAKRKIFKENILHTTTLTLFWISITEYKNLLFPIVQQI